ncbi:DNA-binding protein [Maudiozyma humilis]|uniref:DNA-binding protein n=1 Tax=Maudiozyma humilis TaxID=51915 RepID=A0AAV5RU33_MAUHU|nr:DNA-binding protein [Kazachstania humilis]
MPNLYEYKHPIINTELAASGIDSEPRKFATLDAWQDVINDYEYQARCPIILKNSHRNKHFTYACHLKGCPFKILLSYSNNEPFFDNGSVSNAAAAAAAAAHNIVHGHDDINGNANANSAASDTHIIMESKMGPGSGNGADNSHEQHKGGEAETDNSPQQHRYAESDATDQNVSDAIAAAVAAVDPLKMDSAKKEAEEVGEGRNGSATTTADSKLGVKDEGSNAVDGTTTIDHAPAGSNKDSGSTKESTTDNTPNFSVDDIMLAAHGASDLQNMSIRGPFIVTKIEPYHNHSLEENLTLDKFVLTKVPRILQFDLNFDETLEEIYQKSNHSLSKFKVSQFVEESGLLDILKHRYHLGPEDINKKFISLISRRVTTYKARFVLKKKRSGEYRDIDPDAFMDQSGNGSSASRTRSSGDNAGANSANDISSNGQLDGETQVDGATSAALKGQAASDGVNQHNVGAGSAGSNTHDNSNTSSGHDQSSGHQDGNSDDIAEKAVRAAAQAAMTDESINLKRTFDSVMGGDDDNEVEGEDDLDRYASSSNKRSKMDQSMKNATIDEGGLVSLDDMHDDKLPHDVAEQLRLLSSHFKDVDATSMQNQSVDNENENEDEENNDDGLGNIDDVESNMKQGNDDMSDENIQPELRGQ